MSRKVEIKETSDLVASSIFIPLASAPLFRDSAVPLLRCARLRNVFLFPLPLRNLRNGSGHIMSLSCHIGYLCPGTREMERGTRDTHVLEHEEQPAWLEKSAVEEERDGERERERATPKLSFEHDKRVD